MPLEIVGQLNFALMSLQRLLHQLIQAINEYREMDSGGMPVDANLILQVLVVVAACVLIIYLSRRQNK